MKKQTRFLSFFMVCIILFTMTACGQKTYSTLEEWYADNPLPESETHSTYQGDGFSGTIDITIEENELIYKCTLSKKIFGVDAKMDEIYKEYFDKSFSQQQATFNEIINNISSTSGIDASLISLRYEYYNPGDSTPFYSKSFDKNFF